MRRKSTRNAQKATPDKSSKETETPPKTRRSRRRKRSPSKSSDSEEEVLIVTKRSAPAETPDTTTKSHTPTDEENSEEPVWKVTSTEDSPKGEIHKLKICLTRPSPDSPEKSKPRRSKSNSQTEDETTSSEDKSARRTRSQGSPIVRTDGLSSQEGEEELEEKKGKGKSKGKHKSKIEKSPHLNEPELQTNNEISENVQVTPQSPSIDKPVDNENDHKVDVDDLQNVNETLQGHENVEESASNVGRDSDNEQDEANVSKTKPESCGNTENKESDDDEPLSVIQKTENDKKSENEPDGNNDHQDVQSDSKDKHQDVESDSKDKHQDIDSDSKNNHQDIESDSKNQHQAVESDCTSQNPAVESDSNSHHEDVESSNKDEHVDQVIKSDNKDEHNDQVVESDDKSKDQDVESDNKIEHQDVVSQDQQTSLKETSQQNQLQENAEQSEDIKIAEETSVEPEKQDAVEVFSPKESEGKDTENRSRDENIPEKSTELVPPDNGTEEQIEQEAASENCQTNQSDKLESEKSEEKSTEKSSPSATEEKQQSSRDRAPRRRLKRSVESIQSDSKEKDDTDEISLIKPSRIKRKWMDNSSLKSSLIKVDLESMQTVWPTIDFPEEPDLNLEVEKERRKSLTETSVKKVERKVSVEYKTDLPERPSFEKQTSVNSVTKDAEDSSNIIAFNRKISIVDDTASKLKPPPSPAKNPISNILYITNLVRPFTVKQLKELLERTGKIQEEGFWTDRIKSKCYVQYESQEEAEATRNALHGVQWPIGNGKKLIIDYATEEDMQNAKNPPPPPAPAPAPEIKTAAKENLEPVENKSRTEEKSSKELEKKRAEVPVREWDIGKKELRRDRSRSKERSRKHRRSPSPPDDFISRKQRKAEESVPQKLMDDLFLKTKATPSIYWQPLSPEEISMKQQQRLIRMEEHKRRMEENSRMKGREMGRGAFRRRYD